MTTQALQRVEAGEVDHALKVNDVLAQVRLIQEIMGAVMKENEHFGKIPGCGDKPTLLQPGAQKLLMTFRLAPEYDIQETQLGAGHREYRICCTLKSIQSQTFVGQGIGCCSTMEGKFRFRVAPKTVTDKPVPKEYWDLRGKDAKAAQKLLGGPGFGTKKNEDGQWMITEGSNEKIEHDNPADYYNTVLKMAKKRALVDATLTATAASDIFTQDIEEMPEVIPAVKEAQEAPKPTPTRSATKAAPTPAPQPKKPASGEDDESWRDVICPIPRKGMKRDEYLKQPDTIGSLYDDRADMNSRNRLFGFANEWTPTPREWQGKTYPASDADMKFRQGLDDFLVWQKNHPTDGPDRNDVNEQGRQEDDDNVPF